MLFRQGKVEWEKKGTCGDSFRDRLIIAFHQSPHRLTPLQLEAVRNPLFSILTFSYSSFFRRSFEISRGSFVSFSLSFLFLTAASRCSPAFLSACVDKLTQTPVIFTPGMLESRRKGDIGCRRVQGKRVVGWGGKGRISVEKEKGREKGEDN